MGNIQGVGDEGFEAGVAGTASPKAHTMEVKRASSGLDRVRRILRRPGMMIQIFLLQRRAGLLMI